VRWFAAIFGARDDSRPAVGVSPDRSNLLSIAEHRARRELRLLERLAPPLCGYCGERRPSHDVSCPEHIWSREGFNNAPWEGRKGE